MPVTKTAMQQSDSLLTRVHIDGWLLSGLLVLMTIGLFTIYSASGQDMALIQRQITRLAIGLVAMFALAQVPVLFYRNISPFVYGIGIVLLISVLIIGVTGKGAQRWLDLGVFRFQPSEILKLFVPMTVAWYISKEGMPPSYKRLMIALVLVFLPTILIARQPDLGTSLLIASSGIFALFLAGMSWRIITLFAVLIGGFTPIMWLFLMKAYQKQRVITFLNPQ